MISEAFIPIFCLLAFVFRQIGSDFGYFPKDLLEINHNYTNEELELPTEVSLICYYCFFNWAFYCFLRQHSNKITGKENEECQQSSVTLFFQ